VKIPVSDVKLRITGSTPVSKAQILEMQTPGIFIIRYSPERAGSYEIFFEVDGDKSRTWTVPWRTVRYGRSEDLVDPSKCWLKGLEEVPDVNVPTTFKVITKTKDGKKKYSGNDIVDVKITFTDNATEIPVRIIDEGNGEYLVEFTPTREGPAEVDVAVSGSLFHIDHTLYQLLKEVSNQTHQWYSIYHLKYQIQITCWRSWVQIRSSW